MYLSHLQHKMPIYKDCTLGEVMLVSILTFSFLAIFGSVVSFILCSYLWPGIAFAMLLVLPLARLGVSKLQQLKYGKPYGYYLQYFRKFLSQTCIGAWLPLPLIQREGRWSVRRKVS